MDGFFCLTMTRECRYYPIDPLAISYQKVITIQEPFSVYPPNPCFKEWIIAFFCREFEMKARLFNIWKAIILVRALLGYLEADSGIANIPE